VVGWVMSEKFDGIRGFWNGKQLLTRGGQQIITPDWFIEKYSHSKAMAVLCKIVKLAKNGVLMIIHIYAKVSRN
jgi:ATP-dependent DNA ligase